MEAFQSIRGRGQGCPGNHIDLAFINQVEHAVLDNFRIYGQVLEVGMDKAVDYRVCHIAYAGLERKQVFRKSSLFYFILQKINQIVAHFFSVVIKRSQGAGNIGQITGNNSNNLCRIYRNVGLADTVTGFNDRNRHTVGRIRHFINISHAVQRYRLGGIDFNDDLFPLGYEYRRIADSGRGYDTNFTVSVNDLAGFNDRKIRTGYMFSLDIGEETFTDLLCHMAEMQVEIVDLAGIDCFSQIGVCLIGHTVSDTVYCHQFGINLGTCGSTRPDIYLERCLLHTFSQFMHRDFRIAARCESADPQDIPRLDHGCCRFAVAYFVQQFFRLDTAKEFTVIDVDHYYHPPKINKI